MIDMVVEADDPGVVVSELRRRKESTGACPPCSVFEGSPSYDWWLFCLWWCGIDIFREQYLREQVF